MSHEVHHIMSGFLATLIVVLLGLSAMAQDPSPFRRDDAISGRDVEYGKAVFMHWFTFRPRLENQREFLRSREAFFGTGGSTGSDRLYFHEELHKRFSLDSTLFAAIRHRTDEDFDGEFTSTLTGLGVTFDNGWSATLFGDLGPRKEYIDASVELEWRGDSDSRFRIAVVAADAVHNRKTDTGEYMQAPFTLFSESWVFEDSGAEWGWWLNWNMPVELHEQTGPLQFEYEQISYGARALLPFADSAHMLVEASREAGSRAWYETFGDVSAFRDLDRTHAQFNIETEWRMSRSARMWVGYRYFALTELYTDEYRAAGNGEIDRNENMLHTGVKWRVRRNLIFWPGLYVNHVDIQDVFPADADRSLVSEGLVGKLALPLEIGFGNGASLTLNMSFRTDILRSGGYNVQFFVPL